VETWKLAQGPAYAAAIVRLWRRYRERLRRWADRASRIRWLRSLSVTLMVNWALASSGSALRWTFCEGSAIAFSNILV
jgi:hypothetical protein